MEGIDIKHHFQEGKGIQEKQNRRRCHCIKIFTLIVLILIAVSAGLLPYFLKNHYFDDWFDDNSLGRNNTSNNTHSHPHHRPGNDSRLSRSFWGIDYTPSGAQLEYGCGVTQEEVIEDLKVLHQLTPRLRLYGLDCDQAYYVMNGMKQLKIDMGVILTIWLNGNDTTYERQYHAFWKLLDEFGADHITGVSVGNEALYRKEVTTDVLIERIRDVKSKLKQRGYNRVPVYTTDIRSLDKMMPEEDQVLDNVHPFFAGVSVEQATAWTWKYFKNVVIIPTIKFAKHHGNDTIKPSLISEIGWPTAPESRSYEGAVPSLANLEQLLFNFVCQSNEKGVPYYWFEFKDAPWKNATFNEPREAYWGLFDHQRRLKVNKLPNCPLPSFQKGDVHVPLPSFHY